MEMLRKSIDCFESWLRRSGSATYDPYDLWGSRYGVWAKGLYHKNHLVGAPFVASVFLAEILFPGVRRFFSPRRIFATAHAHLIIGYANLYETTGNEAHLESARTLAAELLKLSIPGYSGNCWGYPFDWPTNRGLWPAGTPMITATPYCFEAYLRLYDLTGNKEYFEIARSAAVFAYDDIKDYPTSETASSCSYTPHDETQVINTNAYRAWMLIVAAERFGKPEYLKKALRNVAFILESQSPDGSWLYALKNPQDAFVDHFHTCFVLKNLANIQPYLNRLEISQALEKGYAYYRSSLFYSDGSPKPFARVKRFQPVKVETYDYAEDVMVGVALRDLIPGAFAFSEKLAERLVKEQQHSSGYFYTRKYAMGIKHALPYIRWPQSQVFNALSKLFLVKSQSDRIEGVSSANKVPSHIVPQ